MAEKLWLGNDPGNEGDWDVDANWQPSTKPVTTVDSVLFDGDAGTSQNVTAFPVGAVTVVNFTVRPSYTGNIASSSDPMNTIISGHLDMQSSGDEFWTDGNISGDATLAPRKASDNACQITGGSHVSLVALRGKVTIGASATITGRLAVDGVAGAAAVGPTVVIASGATFTNADIGIAGGLILCSASVASTGIVFIAGGEFRHILGTIDQSFVGGGTYRHDGGTVTLVEVMDRGRFDSAKTSTAGKAVTTMNIYGPDAEADFRNNGGKTPTTLKKYGAPRVYTDT